MDEERVIALLKGRGLKVTGQRLLVLNIMAAHSDEHLTAEEIYDLAKISRPEIGLATIYRTVQVLLELHIINKVTFDDGYARYELTGED
ncbi:MAG: transcriptional repressor, partial [Lachnospiraceae bacterium]|nr:transcriptional repressor [Lachnospiraceae bacterium]